MTCQRDIILLEVASKCVVIKGPTVGSNTDVGSAEMVLRELKYAKNILLYPPHTGDIFSRRAHSFI